MQAQPPTPITRLQALSERWSLVKDKLTALYAKNRDVMFWLAAMATLTLAVLLFATWWPADRAIEQGPATAHAAAPAADHTAAIVELQAKVDDLLTLAAQQPPTNTPAPRPAAPSWRANANTTPAPQPLPQSSPMPAAAWGTTDLDRAIANHPATNASNTTTGATP